MKFNVIARLTLAACASANAFAQPADNFPVRPLRMIVAFTAGTVSNG